MPPNFWLLPASIVNYEPEVFANAGEKPRIPRNCVKWGIRQSQLLDPRGFGAKRHRNAAANRVETSRRSYMRKREAGAEDGSPKRSQTGRKRMSEC
jgi:tRNA(Leu) C34 or U34 (ribose-2'-O)-methylase TrmL